MLFRPDPTRSVAMRQAPIRPRYSPDTAPIRPRYGPDTAPIRPQYGPIRPGYGPDTAPIRPRYGPMSLMKEVYRRAQESEETWHLPLLLCTPPSSRTSPPRRWRHKTWAGHVSTSRVQPSPGFLGLVLIWAHRALIQGSGPRQLVPGC